MIKYKRIFLGVLCIVAVACGTTPKKTKISSQQLDSSVVENQQQNSASEPEKISVDKNDIHGILYAFQRFVKFPTDTIVDFLERSGEYTVIAINGKTVASGAVQGSDYWGYEGVEEKQVDSLSQVLEGLAVSDTAAKAQLEEKIKILKDEITYREIYEESYYLYADKNAIRKESTYIEGGGGVSVEEYKFLKSEHGAKFIFSEFGGTRHLLNQGEFEVYDYNPHAGKFSLDTASLKLFQVEPKDFYVASTPDSLSEIYYCFFHIIYIKNGAAKCVFDIPNWKFEENKKWIRGNIIRFDFIDGKFTRSEPYFEENW